MASGTWGTGFWGQNQWNDSADPTFTVTGIALSASLGDETTVGEINTGWGRLGWNEQAWGIAGTFIATGDAVTATLGTAVASIDVSTGPSTNNNQLITTALGSVTLDIQTKVFPTGIALTAAEGTADAGPDAMASGIAMSMGLGTIDAFNQTGWGRQGWNVNAWGVEGQFANVTLTGIAMTAGLGTAVGVPGQEVDVTGIPMNNQLAGVTVVIHIDIQLTGLSLTMNQGSGNALIWNEVDTGSAPITPPGWQEVAA